MFILLMLERQLAQMADDVLHLSIVDAAVLAAEIVEGRNLVEEEVCDGDDDGDTDRVSPYHDSGDNISVSVADLIEPPLRVWIWKRPLVDARVEPAEDTEDGRDCVDTSNGTDELPGWESRSSTSNEDEPIFSESDLKEENFLHVSVVLDDTAVWNVHGAVDNPSGEREFDTENDRDDPDLWKLPLYRTRLGVCVVVGNSHGSQISEQSDEHNKFGADGRVDNDHGGHEIDLQMQTQGDSVLDVCLHSLEDLAGNLDGQDDGGQTWGKEDDIGGSLSGFRGALDSDTTVSLFERRRIVDTWEKSE